MESDASPFLVFAIFGGFLIGFPLLWTGALGLISLIGWRKLAMHYREMRQPEGERIGSSRSLRINMANYNGVIHARAGRDGLYLSVMFLFRPFHPPILIPWSDLQAMGPRNLLVFTYFQLRPAQAPSVNLWIPRVWYSRIEPYLVNKSGAGDTSRNSFDPFQ